MNDAPVIAKYLKEFDMPAIYIDIGASTQTSIPADVRKNSSLCILAECDPSKNGSLDNLSTDNIHVIKEKITPENVLEKINPILNGRAIGFLEIDIDGYDYFVLQKILTEHKPTLFCCETNEKIPPPIRFTVKYSENYWWDVSHFYGMSLSSSYDLMSPDYRLINLTGNNAYYLHKSVEFGGRTYSPEEAHKELYDPSRFPHNGNVNIWRDQTTSESIKSTKEFFSKHEGDYEISDMDAI